MERSFTSRQKSITTWIFWAISAITIFWFVFLVISVNKMSNHQLYHAVMVFFGFFLVLFIPKLVFALFTLIKDLGLLAASGSSLIIDKGSSTGETIQRISRSDFLLKTGLILSSIPFIAVLYGIVYGKYNYTIQKVRLSFPNLPKAFDGLRIVQISDLHLGSFNGKTKNIEHAIKMINEQDADYILFTGDMVNTMANEMEPYVPVLKKLKARKGKFSILGNHDYGDYYDWDTEENKAKNFQQLIDYQKEAGLHLLRNESVRLEKDGEFISLIGVENWGKPPFPQHGDLKKATRDVESESFKILMSHDPSHWDAEVRPHSDIDLTLSGHTHGMQFAIRIPGWRWSPVKMKYPRWAGIYKEGRQALYVNIGLGFIAFPGRVGTPPEITLFELNTSA